MASPPESRALELLEAMNAVAALEEIHCATIRLQVEEAYPNARDYLTDDEFQRRHSILTASQVGKDAAELATAALSGVASDFEKLRGIRPEVIGDYMCGWLSEPHGTPALWLALHEWLSATDADEGSENCSKDDLADGLYQKASKLQRKRTKPSREAMKGYRTEVDRLTDRLRVQIPEHISRVEEWIRRDDVGDQVSSKAIAVIACGRAGIELLSDAWLTDVCHLLRGGNPVVGIMSCDNPLAREDKRAIFDQVAWDGEQPVRGLMSGDMWVRRVASIETFSDSRGAYERYHDGIDESLVVMIQEAYLPKSRQCTEEEVSYLYTIRKGFSDVVDRLYDGLLQCAASCTLPEGRCSSREVLRSLKQMEADVPSLFSENGIGLGLSVRSVAALFAAADGKSDFGERIARRMVGCLSTDLLHFSHSAGDLVLKQIGADVMMSGPKPEYTGAVTWFMSELKKLAESRGVSWCGGKRPETRMHEAGFVLDMKYGAAGHDLWRRHCLEVFRGDSGVSTP